MWNSAPTVHQRGDDGRPWAPAFLRRLLVHASQHVFTLSPAALRAVRSARPRSRLPYDPSAVAMADTAPPGCAVRRSCERYQIETEPVHVRQADAPPELADTLKQFFATYGLCGAVGSKPRADPGVESSTRSFLNDLRTLVLRSGRRDLFVDEIRDYFDRENVDVLMGYDAMYAGFSYLDRYLAEDPRPWWSDQSIHVWDGDTLRLTTFTALILGAKVYCESSVSRDFGFDAFCRSSFGRHASGNAWHSDDMRKTEHDILVTELPAENAATQIFAYFLCASLVAQAVLDWDLVIRSPALILQQLCTHCSNAGSKEAHEASKRIWCSFCGTSCCDFDARIRHDAVPASTWAADPNARFESARLTALEILKMVLGKTALLDYNSSELAGAAFLAALGGVNSGGYRAQDIALRRSIARTLGLPYDHLLEAELVLWQFAFAVPHDAPLTAFAPTAIDTNKREFDDTLEGPSRGMPSLGTIATTTVTSIATNRMSPDSVTVVDTPDFYREYGLRPAPGTYSLDPP